MYLVAVTAMESWAMPAMAPMVFCTMPHSPKTCLPSTRARHRPMRNVAACVATLSPALQKTPFTTR